MAVFLLTIIKICLAIIVCGIVPVGVLAQILKCNATRVYGLKDAGLLPFLKLGQLKCRREAVEEFLRKYEGYDVSDPNNIIPLEQGEEVKP